MKNQDSSQVIVMCSQSAMYLEVIVFILEVARTYLSHTLVSRHGRTITHLSLCIWTRGPTKRTRDDFFVWGASCVVAQIVSYHFY